MDADVFAVLPGSWPGPGPDSRDSNRARESSFLGDAGLVGSAVGRRVFVLARIVGTSLVWGPTWPDRAARGALDSMASASALPSPGRIHAGFHSSESWFLDDTFVERSEPSP